ncbi:hypothetical protein QYE76_008645 [Lolium multiflorum]|uniref:Gag-pol polyprotein n=1 Tax=Lolium multiflorum TaxID=4521 RepID=A0AAD8TTT4_LOLMU|nr:hypothetical protein QYE76_008645 [Lolium multiflorum]
MQVLATVARLEQQEREDENTTSDPGPSNVGSPLDRERPLEDVLSPEELVAQARMDLVAKSDVLNKPITPDDAADPEAIEATRQEMLATAKKFANTAAAMLDERTEAANFVVHFQKKDREVDESLAKIRELEKHWEAKVKFVEEEEARIRREAIPPRKITFATPTEQPLATSKDNMKKAAEILKNKDEEIDIDYVRTLVASAMKQQSKAYTSRRNECENVDHTTAMYAFIGGLQRGGLLRHTLTRLANSSKLTLDEMISIASDHTAADDDAGGDLAYDNPYIRRRTVITRKWVNDLKNDPEAGYKRARKHRPRGKGGKGKNKDKEEDSSEAMDEDDNSPDPRQDPQWSEVPCTFDREDHPAIVPKECYALVVSPRIDGYDFSKCLMDGGASLNIMYLETLERMNLTKEQLKHSNRVSWRGSGCHLPTYDAAVLEGPNWPERARYVDDIAVMTRKGSDLISDLTETFDNLRRYKMMLNPLKCVFGVPAEKLLGFIVSHRGIEVNRKKSRQSCASNGQLVSKMCND